MKGGFIVKLVLGLALIVLLILLGARLFETVANLAVNFLTDAPIPDDGSGDYAIITPEPPPTMPAYIGEDSFYDNAGSADFE